MSPCCSVGNLFTSIPVELPKEWRRQPHCTDIVDLPLSIASMDHLDPINYRANFRRNPNTGEKGLAKVIKFGVIFLLRIPNYLICIIVGSGCHSNGRPGGGIYTGGECRESICGNDASEL